MIVLAGAVGLDCLQKMTFAVGTELFRWRREREKLHYLVYTGPLMVMCVLVAGLVSECFIIRLTFYGIYLISYQYIGTREIVSMAQWSGVDRYFEASRG